MNDFPPEDMLRKFVALSDNYHFHANYHKINIFCDVLQINLSDHDFPRDCEEIHRCFNMFAGYPDTVARIHKLILLSDRQSRIPILPGSIRILSHLEYIQVERNNLTTLPDSIGDLASLISINAESNELTKLPSTIGNLTKLEYLNLSRNKLTELPLAVGNLTKLQSLNICENKLCELPESFGKLKHLKILRADDNNISRLPAAMSLMNELTHCYLRGNRIAQYPVSFICHAAEKHPCKYQDYCGICGKKYQKISIAVVKSHISLHK